MSQERVAIVVVDRLLRKCQSGSDRWVTSRRRRKYWAAKPRNQRVEPPSHYYGVPRDNAFHPQIRLGTL
jgi:hypothetical protein